MKLTKMVVDTNAHIANIKCSIALNGDISEASVSFDNLGYGIITAVKFYARGYNAFGNVLPVSGRDVFFLTVQDIHIGKHEHAQNLKIKLPSSDIRRLDLQECQIFFADGTSAAYNGPNVRTFDVYSFEQTGQEKNTLDALRDVVSPYIVNLPVDSNQGWICACGKYNKCNSAFCENCQTKKSQIFQIYDPAYVADVQKKHQQRIEKQREAEKAKEEEAAGKKRKRLLLSLVVIAILCGIAVLSMQKSAGTKDGVTEKVAAVTDNSEDDTWAISEESAVETAVAKAENNSGDYEEPRKTAKPSSQSSTFTNKYGTATTKCAHSGCNNYIASSGDTNCCTLHSNKCLKCGKYIDEDATYCMSCLTNAASGSSNKGSSSSSGSTYTDYDYDTGGYDMPKEDESFSEYVERVDPEMYDYLFGE